jgi:hypothetical protein
METPIITPAPSITSAQLQELIDEVAICKAKRLAKAALAEAAFKADIQCFDIHRELFLTETNARMASMQKTMTCALTMRKYPDRKFVVIYTLADWRNITNGEPAASWIPIKFKAQSQVNPGFWATLVKLDCTRRFAGAIQGSGRCSTVDPKLLNNFPDCGFGISAVFEKSCQRCYLGIGPGALPAANIILVEENLFEYARMVYKAGKSSHRDQ